MQSKHQLLLLSLGKLALVSTYAASVYYFIKQNKSVLWLALVAVLLFFAYVLINTRIETLERRNVVHNIYKQFGIDY